MAPKWVIILLVLFAVVNFGVLFIATFRTPSDKKEEDEEDGQHKRDID